MNLKSAPRTERKLVSILFIDIKGSMDLISAIELEEWWTEIDNLLELCGKASTGSACWISSFTGDPAVCETYHSRRSKH